MKRPQHLALINLPFAGLLLLAVGEAWLTTAPTTTTRLAQRTSVARRGGQWSPLFVATNPARQQQQQQEDAINNNNNSFAAAQSQPKPPHQQHHHHVNHHEAPPDAPLNPLLNSIRPSKTIEIFSMVKQMMSDGIPVTSLCVGEPDFLPPQQVLDAMVAAVHDGHTRYTALTGTVGLRRAIAADLERRRGVSYNPVTEVIVCNGAKQCVYQGIMAAVGAGDKVLIPAPYWPSFPEMTRLVGAEPVIVGTDLELGFKMTPRQFRRALEEHPEIKLFILNNPSNPSGAVYNTRELMDLAEVLRDFPNVLVLADEIYERLVYHGDCPAVASIPGMRERTITVSGFGKSYAMTGLRLGYLAAPTYIVKAVATIQSQITACASSLSQAAGVAALTKVPESVLEENVRIMKSKRDYVLDRLAGMPGVQVMVAPEGAFYALPDVSAFCGRDDTSFCMELLRAKQLALVPGSSMGAPGTVRISYSTSIQELEIAMDKLQSFLQQRRGGGGRSNNGQTVPYE